MPTEQQYRDAASRCRTLAQQYLDHAGGVPMHPADDIISARPVTDRLDGEFAAVARSFHSAAAALGVLASRCEHRADVCRDYRMRVWAWSQATDAQREHMQPPVRPARWVDV